MSTTVCRGCGGVNSPLRWACPHCARATSQRLQEIRGHAVAIATAGFDGQASHDGCEHRPPTRYGLRSALDDCSLREGDPTVAVMAILGSLHRVARYVRHHRGETGSWQCTIDSEVRYLRVNAEWCAHQTWGHELVDVIRQLHERTAERAVQGLDQVRREAS